MRAKQTTKKIRVQVEREQKPTVDPEELWFNQDIDELELIRLDPLEVTPEMEEEAEHPELADWLLQSIPKPMPWRLERLFWKMCKAELYRLHGGQRETPAEFLTRLRGL